LITPTSEVWRRQIAPLELMLGLRPGHPRPR
jgi:hypothetical protein